MEKPTRQEVEDLIKYCSDKERCVPMPPKWVEVMRIIEYEKLEKRYQNASLPNYEIINLNDMKLEKQSWLSKKIIDKVNFHLDKNDQVIFFRLACLYQHEG